MQCTASSGIVIKRASTATRQFEVICLELMSEDELPWEPQNWENVNIVKHVPYTKQEFGERILCYSFCHLWWQSLQKVYLTDLTILHISLTQASISRPLAAPRRQPLFCLLIHRGKLIADNRHIIFVITVCLCYLIVTYNNTRAASSIRRMTRY